MLRELTGGALKRRMDILRVPFLLTGWRGVELRYSQARVLPLVQRLQRRCRGIVTHTPTASLDRTEDARLLARVRPTLIQINTPRPNKYSYAKRRALEASQRTWCRVFGGHPCFAAHGLDPPITLRQAAR